MSPVREVYQLFATGELFNFSNERKCSDMADKNPKHPLKKKKVVAKVNAANQEASTENLTTKSKKHTY